MRVLQYVFWGFTPLVFILITLLLVVGSLGLMTSATNKTSLLSSAANTSQSSVNVSVAATDRSAGWKTAFNPSVNSVYGNKTLSWENTTAIHDKLNKLFPPKIEGDAKQSRATPSLLSSLLGWTTSLQKLAAPVGPSPLGKTRWTWPFENQGTSSLNTTEGRTANDKYGGGSGSHYSHGSDHHHPYSHSYKPPHSYGSYVASPYGGYKPGYSYYPHELPHYPSSENYHDDMYYDHHHYPPPPLPPLPPDGALAPVYKPRAKVSVTADFVELKCCVYGDYLPYIRWVKLAGKNHQGHVLFTTIAEGSHVLYDAYHFAVRSDGRSSRLIIRDPDPHVHYGTYQCQVIVAGDHNHIAKDDFVVGRFY